MQHAVYNSGALRSVTINSGMLNLYETSEYLESLSNKMQTLFLSCGLLLSYGFFVHDYLFI